MEGEREQGVKRAPAPAVPVHMSCHAPTGRTGLCQWAAVAYRACAIRGTADTEPVCTWINNK